MRRTIQLNLDIKPSSSELATILAKICSQDVCKLDSVVFTHVMRELAIGKAWRASSKLHTAWSVGIISVVLSFLSSSILFTFPFHSFLLSLHRLHYSSLSLILLLITLSLHSACISLLHGVREIYEIISLSSHAQTWANISLIVSKQ